MLVITKVLYEFNMVTLFYNSNGEKSSKSCEMMIIRNFRLNYYMNNKNANVVFDVIRLYDMQDVT